MTTSAHPAPPVPPARLVSDGKAEIPWGYGKDRVTAMVVDPNSLCVYWEVTDGSLEAARADLGEIGPRAVLALRVSDTTGRLYDGSNAHSWFDQRIERADRQWFARVGKPGSSAIVELGLLGDKGQFRRIARSGRADFPRAAEAPTRAVEWMTVRVATGSIDEHHVDEHGVGEHGVDPNAADPNAADPNRAQGAGDAPAPERHGTWTERRIHPSEEARLLHFESLPLGNEAVSHTVWESEYEAARYTWHWSAGSWEEHGGNTSWQAGPFAYPVSIAAPVREQFEGEAETHEVGGELRVVTRPWHVVIRGLGAYASRQVIARWEVRRTVPTEVVTRRVAASSGPMGSSLGGASELTLRGHSEVRFSGASEVYYLGASELRRRGASERLIRGASERLLRGASERLLRGASERRPKGASERLPKGASERLPKGASERLPKGASERLPKGTGSLGVTSGLNPGLSVAPQPGPSRGK